MRITEKFVGGHSASFSDQVVGNFTYNSYQDNNIRKIKNILAENQNNFDSFEDFYEKCYSNVIYNPNSIVIIMCPNDNYHKIY